jgi:lipopolysaccharide export system protein LptC
MMKHIMDHLSASGPATFPQIAQYVRTQFHATAQDWEIAAAVNKMIRDQMVYLYDTGDAFDCIYHTSRQDQ